MEQESIDDFAPTEFNVPNGLYTAISVTNGITSGTYDYQGHQLLTNSVAFDLFNCKVKGSESSGAQLSYLVGRRQVASTYQYHLSNP